MSNNSRNSDAVDAAKGGRKQMRTLLLLVVGGLLAGTGLEAQGVSASEAEIAGGEKISIAFRDASRPGTVRMNAIYGSITVRAYAGKEVMVQMDTKGTKEKEKEKDLPEAAKGMRRLNANGGSISMEEENNIVTVSLGWRTRGESIVVSVPVKTNLKLSCVNGKSLNVEGVEGEIELSATNGNVLATDVAGSIVAHSINGKVVAKIKRIDGDKPMSFSSMNGTVDVTLPAATKANLKIQSNNGDVFSDFDVQMKPSAAKTEKSESGSGKNQVRMESMTLGAINGGGPEYTFRNYNGNIYIRKAN
jgi:hypothetical protein